MEIYGYVLKENLPNNHLENKSQEIIKACERFYKAFDRKIPMSGVDSIDDMTLEYFEAFDSMISLNSEDFISVKNQIKELVDQHKWRQQLFQEKQSQQLKAI